MNELQEILARWFKSNMRELPWRDTPSPYYVWLSEVILQQTRVSQGLDYFNRFVQQWPTLADLAKASEEEVLKMWQGLGYYSRARNLHRCARQVVEEYDGVFPEDLDELKKLQGIGGYTAAAIASIAFGKPHAVVDGNVYRVLARLYNIETPINSNEGVKAFAELADTLLDRKHPVEPVPRRFCRKRLLPSKAPCHSPRTGSHKGCAKCRCLAVCAGRCSGVDL